MQINAGKYRAGFNIEEQEYEVQNGIDFFSRYLFPAPEQIRDHFELKSISMVGGPGTGKSTKIRFLVDFIRDTWGPDNVNAMLTDNVMLAIENLNDKMVQVVVVDDAIGKQDSRRSMGDENVSATQQFMMIRHIARQRYAGGIVYVIFAYQDPTSIDKRFRSTCDLVLYSAYYMNEGLERHIKDKDSIRFLKKITREQTFNNYAYRAYAVGHTKIGDIVHIKFPYILEDQFTITRLESAGRKDELKHELIQKLIELDLVAETDQVIEGWLLEHRERTPELEIYQFGGSDFREIIKRARSRVALSGGGARVKQHFGALIRWVREAYNISYVDLEGQTGIPHTVMHRYAAMQDEA